MLIVPSYTELVESPLKKKERGSAVIFSWMAARVPACAHFRTLLRDTEATGP